jgi:hypothetical protein
MYEQEVVEEERKKWRSNANFGSKEEDWVKKKRGR